MGLLLNYCTSTPQLTSYCMHPSPIDAQHNIDVRCINEFMFVAAVPECMCCMPYAPQVQISALERKKFPGAGAIVLDSLPTAAASLCDRDIKVEAQIHILF